MTILELTRAYLVPREGTLIEIWYYACENQVFCCKLVVLVFKKKMEPHNYENSYLSPFSSTL